LNIDMANKEAVFSLRVDTGNSVQDVQSFDKAVNNLNKDLQATQKTAASDAGTDAFAEKLAELNARVEAGGLSLREMTQVMKQYQTIAAQAGVESPVGAQAIQNAANLKDEIGDLKAQTTALSSDFVGLDTALAGIDTGAAIFGGFQSAIALTGVESEQLVQTMVKLQAVQGVVNAVSTVANNLNKEAILGIQLRNVAQKIQNAFIVENTAVTTGNAVATTAMSTAQKAAAVATNLGTLAMKALNAVMKANPIFLIIAALAAIAGAFIAFGDNSAEAAESNEKFNKSLENGRKALDDSFSALQKYTSNRIALMKAAGATDEEITKAEIKNLEILAKARQDARVKEQYGFQNLQKRYQQMLDQGNEDEAAKIREQLTTSRERYVKLGQQAKDYYADIKQQRAIDAAENVKKVQDNAKKVAENAEKVQKDQADKSKAAADKAREQRKQDLAKIKEVEDAFNLSMLSNKEQEIAAEQKKFNEVIALAVKNNQDTTTLRLALKNSLNDIEAKYAQIEIDLADKTAKEKRDIEIETFNKKEALRREEIATEEAFFDEYNAALLTAQQTEEQAVTDKYFKLIEGAKQYGLDITKLEEQQQQEISKIQNKYNAERLQKQLDNAQFIFDQFSALNDAFSSLEDARMQNMQTRANDELSALDAKHKKELEGQNLTADQKKAIDDNYAAAKYQIELKNFNALEAIKKKQFERDKILRIGQAAIDTASAIVKGIAQFGPPPSPAGIAAIASAALIGATQIAAIAATKYQSGTAPTFDTSGGVSAGASANELGGANANTNTQQTDLTGLAAQQSAGINQVYVLESDITGTQNNVAIQNKLSVW
jgi:hypothetical protein